MRHSSLLVAILASFAVAGCHGGGDAQQLGTLVDANATADAVSESARPGTPVGITITAPDLASRGGVTFTLANDANGAFKIDSVTGVISLAASVDYERTPRLSITAHAQSADNHYFAEQAFAIEVIDSPAPSIQIDFPFTHAPYAYATAAVSGRITHPEPSNISVRASAGGATVDGLVDANGHFYVRGVPVAEGDPMTLTVTASHAGNESATSSVVLSRAPDLSVVGGMIVDPTRDRYLLADGGSGTIVAIARNGYARSIVSGAGRGTGPLFDGPYRLALDTDRDLVYVTDATGRAVLSVDPRSGNRALVSAGGVITPGRGTGEQLLDPKGIVYDAARRRILVADGKLVAIDPLTGDRTTISNNNPVFGPTLYYWDSLALDAPRNRVIAVTVSIFAQYGIDLTTGFRSVVSDETHDFPEANRTFTGISVSAARGVAYLADEFSNAVVRMDLATGQRTSVTSSGLNNGLLTHPVIGSGPELEWPTDVLYDESLGRLLVIDEGFAVPLIQVDETTGDRTLLTNGAVGSGVNFKDPSGLALSPDGRTVFVVDYVADIVVAVNLDTGSRQLIAGSPTGRGTIATDPLGIALDAASGKLYVVDFTANSLYELDIASGARRTVSDAGTGAGPLLDNPVDVAVDTPSHVAYVVDARLGALVAVDIASGQRRIVAGAFGTPAGLALDSTHGLAYITDREEVVRIDLASGLSSTLSSRLVGAGPWPGDLVDVALDAPRGRLLVLDTYPNRVLAVELATGNRTTLSGISATNGGVEVAGGVRLGQPRHIEVDESRQIAYVTDNAYDAVIAVDLASGYRQMVSK